MILKLSNFKNFSYQKTESRYDKIIKSHENLLGFCWDIEMNQSVTLF